MKHIINGDEVSSVKTFLCKILLIYPYLVSAYNNQIYGLINMLIFFILLTLGFVFELGKKALNIESKQLINVFKQNHHTSLKILRGENEKFKI